MENIDGEKATRENLIIKKQPETLKYRRKRIEKLEAENKRFKEQIEAYRVQFVCCGGKKNAR